MPQLTTKLNFNRLAEVIQHMPDNGEFVIDFSQGKIFNLDGDQIAEFSKGLFTKVKPEQAFGTDADSALEEIDPSPARYTDNLNHISEKH